MMNDDSIQPFAPGGAPPAADPFLPLSAPVRRAGLLLGLAAVVCLAFLNLTRFPATWFDEGSHLHVPKTLVTLGRYADFSDGELRYYGPTVGVGPTVMLPVAVAFKVAGVGLLQARVVMALYLLLAIAAFYGLARRLGSPAFALGALLLLLTSPTISLFENGRQVLGEVPGLFYLSAGLALWFSTWEVPRVGRLVGAAVLLALACSTKHVYLISILPGLFAAGVLNWWYYKRLPHRVFVVPVIIVGAIFAAWQAILIAGLGPGTAADNLRLLQDATRGAALVFSVDNMRRAAGELLSVRTLAGCLIPAMLWGGVRLFSRDDIAEQRWSTIWLMAAANLSWYVLASAGWPRYAFAGLTLSCLLVARLIRDLLAAAPARVTPEGPLARRWFSLNAGHAVGAWVLAISLGFLARTTARIVIAPYPAAQMMAAYLNAHVGTDRVIHTWEPEMSLLSEHRFHFPPPQLLIVAVAHQFNGGPGVAQSFDFEGDVRPDYVLEGPFGAYVQLYPASRLERDYRVMTREGGYTLYERKTAQSASAELSTSQPAFSAPPPGAPR